MEAHTGAVEEVGVIGAGTMGSGIAQVAAASGYRVQLVDVDADALDAGLERIDAGLDRAVEGGHLDANAVAAARERLDAATDLEAVAEADLAVEAVVEDLGVKQDVFTDLDALLGDDAILATNTSTISISRIAAATDRPEQVVGIHFMNPVPVMKGVEIVVGEHTADEVLERSHAFAERLGKETWESDDKPGFVVNRIAMPWINEGIRAYDEGVASKEDIDRAMRLGTNVPMGPLELADYIGLDVVLAASETIADDLGERHRPAYLLRRKVAAGDLGKKTGRGFYEH